MKIVFIKIFYHLTSHQGSTRTIYDWPFNQTYVMPLDNCWWKLYINEKHYHTSNMFIPYLKTKP